MAAVGSDQHKVEKLALDAKDGFLFRAYRRARRFVQPLYRLALRRRIANGKEEPERAQEKLGRATLPRPEGRLVWLHAVGLGEVLALRPLIREMQRQDTGLQFLVTSTARASGNVFSKNLPQNTRHQFLPFDAPAFTREFLKHWQPDLSIWSEQDLWPGIIADLSEASVPIAYVNGRMNAESHSKRSRLRGLYRDTLKRFDLLSAQNGESAANIADLAGRCDIGIVNLKPAADVLSVNETDLHRFRKLLADRRVWAAASTHPPDEPVVMEACERLFAENPNTLAVLVPRYPDRADETAAALASRGIPFARRSLGENPGPGTAVFLADTFGELGLWYRLAEVAFIGGSFGAQGGHNPWEAICLGVPVIAGPDTTNFKQDYDELIGKALAVELSEGDTAGHELAEAVRTLAAKRSSEAAEALVATARDDVRPLARDLIGLLGERA